MPDLSLPDKAKVTNAARVSEANSRERPPSVDALARAIGDIDLPHAVLVDCARRSIEGGTDYEVVARRYAQDFEGALIGEVINATGVLLHTNLGRAPYAGVSGTRALSVEYDLAEGVRGSRHDAISEMLRLLTGAEAAIVVNNNAAAVLLVLAALAEGRSVAVSRGESVEIGGGFRIPEVMARSGARLVDVGTTNRTRLSDYSEAARELGDELALVLKVHPSNFEVSGFIEDTSIRELTSVGVPVIADLGSGLLDNNAPWMPAATRPLPNWISDEPGAVQALNDGADVVMFSGDKLLGGPQCGIIAGRADLIERCARHPLMRAMRPGQHALVPLQRVLLSYLIRGVIEEVPFWGMVAVAVDELETRAASIIEAANVGEIRATHSVIGAGAAPGATLPSVAVVVPGDVSRQLRMRRPVPIVGRVAEGHTWLDLRTVHPDDDQGVAAALSDLVR